MRRNLFLIAISYFITLIAASAFGLNISFFAFLILILTILVFIATKAYKKYNLIFISIVVCAIAAFSFCAYTCLKVVPVSKLDGKDCEISATLCEEPEQVNGKYYYTLKTDSISDSNVQKIKFKVSSSSPININIYDKIHAKVHFYKLKDDNETLNSSKYQNSKGIFINAYMYNYQDYNVEPSEHHPPYYYALKLREKISRSIDNLLPETQAQLAKAVMLGDKNIDQDIKENMQIAGVSHVMCVSGLHLAIIGQFFMLLFLSLKFSKKLSAVLTAIFILMFMAIVGFVPSIARAGIMAIIFYLGIALEKEPDSINSLAVAVLILCLINPLAGGDTGLILSFFATLGILAFSPKVKLYLQNKTKKFRKNKYSNKIISFMNETISATFCATILTLPFVMVAFSRISLIAILGNILIVYPASLMMVFVLIAAVVNLTGIVFLALPFAFCVYILSHYIIFILNLLSKIPFASISTSYGFVSLWVAFTMFIIAYVILVNKAKQFKILAFLISFIILLCAIASYQITNLPYTQVSILNCGNNMDVCVKNNGYFSVLSSGASSANYNPLENYLKEQNIFEITTMLVPDARGESSLGAGKIIEKYKPNYLILNEKVKNQEKTMTALDSLNSNENINYFKSSASIQISNCLNANVLTKNEKSFIFANINGFNIIICPSRADVKDIPKNMRTCDFFVMSQVPKNVDKIKCTYTVLSMYEDKAENAIKFNKLPNTNYILKTSDSNILLKLKQDKSAIISNN